MAEANVHEMKQLNKRNIFPGGQKFSPGAKSSSKWNELNAGKESLKAGKLGKKRTMSGWKSGGVITAILEGAESKVLQEFA